MSYLYWANVTEDEDDPTALMRDTYYRLIDMYGYVQAAIWKK